MQRKQLVGLEIETGLGMDSSMCIDSGSWGHGPMERECEVDDPLISHSWTLGLAVVDTPGTHWYHASGLRIQGRLICGHMGHRGRTHIRHALLRELLSFGQTSNSHSLQLQSHTPESCIQLITISYSFHKHILNTCEATLTRWNTVQSGTCRSFWCSQQLGKW